jgi:hypothetical protein
LHGNGRITASVGRADGLEERTEELDMSTVGASGNSFVQVQAVWKRGQPQSSGAAQGDAPSQSFAPTSTQAANTSSSPPPQPGAKAATSVGTFPRFEPQTLQTLLALQSVK